MLQRNQLHSYQERGVKHILDNEFCALFLDMGLGKSVTTLTAIKELLDGYNIERPSNRSEEGCSGNMAR